MGRSGVCGIQNLYKVLLVVDCGKVLECGEIFFFYSAFGLRWALIVKSDSGTIVGVRINLQR